jgi:1,4-dihydroxy-2-naphthoyl-CoA hydrolase
VPLRTGFDLDYLNLFGREFLPDLVGLVLTNLAEGSIAGELAIRKDLLAPNGYLHAATVVALADTLAGYGCVAHLPEKAANFTTVELKANFLNTARDGTLRGEARAVHLGRTTQVWDATVTCGDRKLALFRCTQLVIYPK